MHCHSPIRTPASRVLTFYMGYTNMVSKSLFIRKKFLAYQADMTSRLLTPIRR
jgi:hypothetical protein